MDPLLAESSSTVSSLASDSRSEKPLRRSAAEKETVLSSIPFPIPVASLAVKMGLSLTPSVVIEIVSSMEMASAWFSDVPESVIVNLN